jgi:hemolysin activation/secretion protein
MNGFSTRPPRRQPRIVVLLMLLSCAMSSAVSAAAQPAAAQISSLGFIGVRELPVSRLQAATASFLGAPLDEPTLNALQQRVQQFYDDNGYGLVRVATPVVVSAERGAVIVRIRELRVSEVQVLGARDAGGASPLTQLPALTSGKSPQLDALSRQLFLYNDNPRRQAAIDFQPDDTDGLRAQLSLSDQPPLYGSFTIDNTGTEETGRGRLRLSGGHADLFGRGIVGEVLAVTSTEGQTVRQGIARLSVPLVASGGSLEFSLDHARSDLGAVLAFSSISGRSTGGRIGYRHPISRATGLERFLDISIEQRSYDDVYDFSGVNLGSSVATRPVTAGYSAILRQRWILQQSFSLTANIPGGGDNAAAHYAASRFGADEDWLRANASLVALRDFGSWQLSGRATGQYSSDALISGEQFRAGGAGLLRGLIEGEIAGDSGIAVGIELVVPWLNPLRGFCFAEAARATRNLSPAGSPDALSAMTAGLGLRSPPEGPIGFEISFGHVLGEDGLPESRPGDSRLHASLRFNL